MSSGLLIGPACVRRPRCASIQHDNFWVQLYIGDVNDFDGFHFDIIENSSSYIIHVMNKFDS